MVPLDPLDPPWDRFQEFSAPSGGCEKCRVKPSAVGAVHDLGAGHVDYNGTMIYLKGGGEIKVFDRYEDVLKALGITDE